VSRDRRQLPALTLSQHWVKNHNKKFRHQEHPRGPFLLVFWRCFGVTWRGDGMGGCFCVCGCIAGAFCRSRALGVKVRVLVWAVDILVELCAETWPERVLLGRLSHSHDVIFFSMTTDPNLSQRQTVLYRVPPTCPRHPFPSSPSRALPNCQPSLSSSLLASFAPNPCLDSPVARANMDIFVDSLADSLASPSNKGVRRKASPTQEFGCLLLEARPSRLSPCPY
jgi:hypothetical protein